MRYCFTASGKQASGPFSSAKCDVLNVLSEQSSTRLDTDELQCHIVLI
jgi:hypothetical protein